MNGFPVNYFCLKALRFRKSDFVTNIKKSPPDFGRAYFLKISVLELVAIHDRFYGIYDLFCVWQPCIY